MQVERDKVQVELEEVEGATGGDKNTGTWGAWRGGGGWETGWVSSDSE